MRHSLYKYFSDRKWADAFLDGEILFRSLSYFRDYEDKNVRGDEKEGTAVYRPKEGAGYHEPHSGHDIHAFRSCFRVSRESGGNLRVLRKQIAIRRNEREIRSCCLRRDFQHPKSM